VPLADDDGRVRALIRFEYGAGTAVATTLRAQVIADAVQRRRGKGRPTRASLALRLDILEPEI
jgi:primosomal protein N' (replication factor Y)